MKAPQDIILKPVITEQSTDILPEGKYTFKVAKDANKLEIADAVEKLFNVEVTKVNTVNVRARAKRVGRYMGKTASWKKAGRPREYLEGDGIAVSLGGLGASGVVLVRRAQLGLVWASDRNSPWPSSAPGIHPQAVWRRAWPPGFCFQSGSAFRTE